MTTKAGIQYSEALGMYRNKTPGQFPRSVVVLPKGTTGLLDHIRTNLADQRILISGPAAASDCAD